MSNDPQPQDKPENAQQSSDILAPGESGGVAAERNNEASPGALNASEGAVQVDPGSSNAQSSEEYFEGVSAELVDIVAEPEQDQEAAKKASRQPPLPRSMRPKSAKDVASLPLGVTATLPAPIWPPRTVADLMVRKIITVREDEPIGDLEELMQKFRFGHLPVVGTQNKLVGLITRTDLLHAQLGKMPEGSPQTKVEESTPAGALMRKNVVFAKLDTSITTTAQVMLANKLPCIPIVLDDLTLVGIVTESDFVRLSLVLLGVKQK